MEKKTTVPPSAVARTAPCSAPGTSTQTTVTSTGSPTASATHSRPGGSAAPTAPATPARRRARQRVGGVGAHDGGGQARRAERIGLPLVLDDADQPAGVGVPGGG